MNTKHTPGPWYVSDGGFFVRKRDGRHPAWNVCDVNKAAALDGSADEALANARLIASAPELLESLRKILDWTLSTKGVPVGYIEAEARAAIDKAT